jgi:hypothetical protein
MALFERSQHALNSGDGSSADKASLSLRPDVHRHVHKVVSKVAALSRRREFGCEASRRQVSRKQMRPSDGS